MIFLIVWLFVHGSYGLAVLQRNSDLKNPFVGFYVFPHGGITLDPETMDYSDQPAFKETSKEKATQLNKAMQNAAEALIETKPDLIIFSTPHGFHLIDRNVILSSASVSGTAGWIWSNFTATFDIDKDLSNILFAELDNADDPIELMGLGSGGETLPILWAEVIPWYFIRKAAFKANYKVPPAVYIGQPSRFNIEKLRDLGRDIAKTALLRNEFGSRRIAVVISGDLSHYHSNDTNSPYPYSKVSKIFDEHIVNWARIDRNSKSENISSTELLVTAGKLEREAGHCGYTGFVMLHGILEELVNQGWSFKSRFYTYQVPTYFGMMIASWIPESESSHN